MIEANSNEMRRIMGGNKAGAKKRWRAKVRKRVILSRLKKAATTPQAAAEKS